MKSIAIIGSCVSRDLFNETRIKNKFEVNYYSFQSNIWDMFSNSLDAPKEAIDSLPLENFTRRMVYYDINKTAIPALADAKCEYIMLDLFVIWRECYRLISNGKTIYFKNNRGKYISDFLASKLGYDVKMLKFEEIDESLIKDGLTKLAEFLKEHFDEEKIILHYPLFSKRYWNLNNKIINFNEKDQTNATYRKGIIYKWTDFLFDLLPKAKKLQPESFLTNTIAIHLSTDDFALLPNPVHSSYQDQTQIVTKLLELLGESTASALQPVHTEFLTLNNKYINAIKVIEKLQKNVLTSLNNYFNNIIDLNKHIIIISVKNQAAEYIHKFFSKTKLGLKMEISPSQSYVAVVNKQENYIYEEISDSFVEISYKLGKKTITAASEYSKNFSSIKIGDEEFSTNRRGLNFVILNNKTLEVVDKFFCDTYADEYLLIAPKITNKE